MRFHLGQRRPLGRIILAALLIGVLASTATLFVQASDVLLTVDAQGHLDARFQGLEIQATISGEIVVTGDVAAGDDAAWLSMHGWGTGYGVRDILSLTTKGWILLGIDGASSDGVKVSIRAILYSAKQSLIALQADIPIEGIHHLAIRIGDATMVYEGTFSGSLSGGVVPSGTDGVLRLSGQGGFALHGLLRQGAEPSAFPPCLELDDSAIPETFSALLRAQFDSLSDY